LFQCSKSGFIAPNNFIDFISNVLLSVYMCISVFVRSYKTYYKVNFLFEYYI
jgi:hypothetical protein